MEEFDESPIIQRLKQFIAQTGLSITQFADKAGIPRPTFSQMLRGRNRSLNNQTLEKFAAAFPEIDILWLLFGDKYPGQTSNIKTSEPQNIDDSLSTASEIAEKKETTYHINHNDETSSSMTNQTEVEMEYGEPHKTWAPSVFCSSSDTSVKNPAPAKLVTSIIVFYSDNSFETFVPR